MKNYLICFVFILASCNGQKKASGKNPQGQLKSDTSLVLLLQDEHTDFDVEETMVIKDQKRLKVFYSKINMTRKPGLPVPIIDFSKEMVIVQCSGEQNHSGLPILTFDKETGTQVVFRSKLKRESDSRSTKVITSPFCVYKVPLTTKEIVVKK